MIYYHKYGSDRFMRWATLERDDIMKTEKGDIFDFDYDNHITWEVINVTMEGKYLTIVCYPHIDMDSMLMETNFAEEEYDSDSNDEEDLDSNNKDSGAPRSNKLVMLIKHKRKLHEYKITITRPDRVNELNNTVCREDKYPFGDYNPYDGH